jgi:hypothetical protein
MMTTEAYVTDLRDSEPLPDRIKLVGQLAFCAPGDSIYEYFLSDEARAAKERLQQAIKNGMRAAPYRREYYDLRERDLRAALARFPGYEVRPPAFAGDISLYRKED